MWSVVTEINSDSLQHCLYRVGWARRGWGLVPRGKQTRVDLEYEKEAHK